MPQLPRIAISMGDPAGVGPELCCRVCADPDIRSVCQPVIIGNADLLAHVAAQLDLPLPEHVDPVASGSFDPAAVAPGTVAASNGAIAIAAVEAAIAGCQSGHYQGMVTAPIHKQAIHLAGCPYPGHTELLSERCGSAGAMLLYDPSLAVALVTVHQSLRSVAIDLDQAAIVHTGRLLAETLAQIRGRPARIAVLGLNPHAGEGGLFGDEEATVITPAIAALQALGIDATGPLPPDTAFTATARAHFDGHLCMYHDQGLIPFKALAFDHGVNVTMGLPIVRTSPDHGTAFDLAWQGKASATSLRAAVLLAAQLASQE